jgi:hypothetical protein
MVQHIGYLHIHAADSIRYPIYKEHVYCFFVYKDGQQIPLKLSMWYLIDVYYNPELLIDIVLDNSPSYDAAYRRFAKSRVLDYIYINGRHTTNKGIIDFNPLYLDQ